MAKKKKSTGQKQRAAARRQHQDHAGPRPAAESGTAAPEGARPEREAERPAREGARPSGPSRRPSQADARPNARPRPAARGKASARGRRGGRRGSSRSLSSGAVIAVVAVVAVMVIMFATRKSGDTGPGSASAKAIQQVTSVPASTLEQVGAPSGGWNFVRLPAGTPAVESGGKPMVMYIGAEYCPFCAGERWPMVVALSRFGTFSGLEGTTSGPPPEVHPNTATLSFAGSSYTSDYLTFSSVETEDRNGNPLQSMSSQQQDLFSTYNTQAVTGSNGAIPFVMIGNLYTWAGTSVDPGILQGKSFNQIAAVLADPNSDIAKAIDGSANEITAMICQLTGNQPTDVCSAPYIQQAQSALPAS